MVEYLYISATWLGYFSPSILPKFMSSCCICFTVVLFVSFVKSHRIKKQLWRKVTLTNHPKRRKNGLLFFFILTLLLKVSNYSSLNVNCLATYQNIAELIELKLRSRNNLFLHFRFVVKYTLYYYNVSRRTRTCIVSKSYTIIILSECCPRWVLFKTHIALNFKSMF